MIKQIKLNDSSWTLYQSKCTIIGYYNARPREIHRCLLYYYTDYLSFTYYISDDDYNDIIMLIESIL